MGVIVVVLAVAILSGYAGRKVAKSLDRSPNWGMVIGFLIPIAGVTLFKAMGPKINQYTGGRHGN